VRDRENQAGKKRTWKLSFVGDEGGSYLAFVARGDVNGTAAG